MELSVHLHSMTEDIKSEKLSDFQHCRVSVDFFTILLTFTKH